MSRAYDKILSLLENNQQSVIDWLNERADDVETYVYLQRNSKLPLDRAYKENYWDFYRLFRLGNVHRDFYFSILERYLKKSVIRDGDFENILDELKDRTNKYWFSYTTKLIHTINNDYPIYDDNLRRVFAWGDVYGNRAAILERYSTLKVSISELLSDTRTKEFIEKMRRNFDSLSEISDTKIFDFALWALGDLIRRGIIIP